jgi:hypothetical protein
MAALIAVKTRDGAGAEEIRPLRERLDQLRVREVYDWARINLKLPPSPAELAQAERTARSISGAA